MADQPSANAPSRVLAVALLAAALTGCAGGDEVPVVEATTTTWSEARSYCDEHEHRIFIGPTNGTDAPSIDVVPYEPSCRP